MDEKLKKYIKWNKDIECIVEKAQGLQEEV